ncbi:MAG: hypothetical protein EPO22_00965 [Dehalococcoidia bacterium]|nr:MAG: hypothetical protein EPO22_00965 [Dehalococcoidia bacterium]
MQGAHSYLRRARGLARLSFAGAALCALAALQLHAHTAAAAPAGAITMNPANTSMAVGDETAVTLDIAGGANIHSVRLGISFNAAVVQIVDADAVASGVQILPGPFPGQDGVDGSVVQNLVSSGIINYQFTLNGLNEVSGGGTVATVQLRGLAAGSADLSWTLTQIADANGGTTSMNGASAIVLVGGAQAPTATNTPPGTETSTPVATDTPAPTDTPVPTSTATTAATGTTSPTATGSATPTRTATISPTPTITRTPAASATARITVLSPTPPRGAPPASAIEPAAKPPGLPSAGNDGPGIAWWKWTFFAGALMLAGAGWFFTFALHAGNREVVLLDRKDRRRRRRY